MLLFIIPILYLLVGTFAARAYVTAHKGLDFSEVIKIAAAGLDALTHTNECWHGSRHQEEWRTSRYNCDCSNASAYRSLHKKYLGAFENKLPNPYPMVFAWPFLGYHKFLISGTPRPSAVEISNADRIAELEKELNIG